MANVQNIHLDFTGGGPTRWVAVGRVGNNKYLCMYKKTYILHTIYAK